MPRVLIEYQILALTGVSERHATIKRYESDKGEFWGAFLPDGRMIAIDGELSEDNARIVFREASKQHSTVQ